MTHAYTDKQIIRFIYKECDLFEKFEMEFAFEDDSTLFEQYRELNKGYKTLPKVTFSPAQKTIDSILSYAACPK